MAEIKKDLRLLSIDQAAKELRIGRSTINKLINEGKIGVIEFDSGRIKIPISELTRWVQDNLRYTGRISHENGNQLMYSETFNAHKVLFGEIKME